MSIRKNTIWNLFGSASPMLIGAVTLPFLLKSIGIEKLGVLTMVWALIGYFSIFDFGMGRALTHKISILRVGNNQKEVISSTKVGLLLMLLTGIAGTVVVLLLLMTGGVQWLNFSDSVYADARRSMIIAGISIPLTTMTSGMKGVLEGFEEFGAVNVLRFFLGMSNFISPVVAILIFGPSLSIVVLCLVASRLIILVAHYRVMNKFVPGVFFANFSMNEEARGIFKFGVWMTLSNVISPLMVIADRFVISNLVGAAVVAYYTVPSEFLIRILILPAALTTTLFPVFAKKISTNLVEAHDLYKKSLKFIFVVMFPLLSLIACCSRFGLNIWLGANFADNSYLVVIVMALGILFNSLAQIPHSAIQANGNVKLTSLIHLGEFILYAPLLIGLVHIYGILGAALAWTVRACIDFLILHKFASIKFSELKHD
ncbi:flippase [Undibacterium rugosum]|uniref:flippase n=1 Tax=Undibacterium rugosum TaxID=2762291 RepID=UPI001B827238|nr:flippase [Undibacterium rugosum]MBR7779952.1 flippase [Undibacterium rugosum]